jgi:hypothetical protein
MQQRCYVSISLTRSQVQACVTQHMFLLRRLCNAASCELHQHSTQHTARYQVGACHASSCVLSLTTSSGMNTVPSKEGSEKGVAGPAASTASIQWSTEDAACASGTNTPGSPAAQHALYQGVNRLEGGSTAGGT